MSQKGRLHNISRKSPVLYLDLKLQEPLRLHVKHVMSYPISPQESLVLPKICIMRLPPKRYEPPSEAAAR